MKLYYSKAELPALIGLSESTIDEEIRQDRFPKPRQLAGRRVGYFWNDILEWAVSRPRSCQPPPVNAGAKRAAPISGAAAPAAPAARQAA